MKRLLLYSSAFVAILGLQVANLSWRAITTSAVDVKALIASVPPPPAPGSPEDRTDLDAVLLAQSTRTPAQVEFSQHAAGHSVFTFAQPVLGSWFSPENLPVTAELFAQLDGITNEVIQNSKKKWKRPRPYERSDKVEPVVYLPGNPSYPSGHSAMAAMWGDILGELIPSQREAFRKEVEGSMRARVVGGVHFPSDTIAGDELGRRIASALMDSADVQAQLQAARAELIACLLSQPAVATAAP
jgi:Membrane-associated phospholipid phosphatase